MARKGRRVLARRRAEHDQDVRRGRYADDFDAARAVEEVLRPLASTSWTYPRRHRVRL
jgi:hypothetical protein